MAVIAAALGACAAKTDRVAPFRERPDTVDAGELRGPFTGTVVDAETGEPVRDAIVYASWSFTAGYGEQVPAGFRERATTTDATGRYEIPALTDDPGEGRLTGAYLVVYKPGYVAYRSDRRFSDLALRRDFAQRNNEVKLARWRPEYSHVRHVRFLGGGAALAEATADERARAAAELAGEVPERALPLEPVFERPTDEPAESEQDEIPDLPRAADVLTEELVAEVTGDEGPFEAGPLGDQPDTETYSSQHLRAVDRSEAYDVALRVWAEGRQAAERRYRALEESLPEAETRDEVADRSLRTVEPGLMGVAFLDEASGVIALLVCGEELCETPDVALELARAVHAELVGAEAEAETEAETETETETETEAETETETETEAETETDGDEGASEGEER